MRATGTFQNPSSVCWWRNADAGQRSISSSQWCSCRHHSRSAAGAAVVLPGAVMLRSGHWTKPQTDIVYAWHCKIAGKGHFDAPSARRAFQRQARLWKRLGRGSGPSDSAGLRRFDLMFAFPMLSDACLCVVCFLIAFEMYCILYMRCCVPCGIANAWRRVCCSFVFASR